MMSNSSELPLYMIQPGHPVIEEWRPWFERFERDQIDMVFLAEPSDIQNNSVEKIHQMAMALQHFPQLIEKMVFNVTFDFNLVEGIDVARSDDWKRDPAIRQWLFKMAEGTMLIFLVKDSTSRFFMLADDILSNVKVGAVGFDNEQQQVIMNRVFTACYSFFMYCHNTGFHPDGYIDGLLAEHDMPFTLEVIKNKYLEDVKNGVDFRADG